MGMNNIGRIEPVHEMASEGLILLNIGHAVHYADWNYKNVNSPFARIYLVDKGEARLHLPDGVQQLSPRNLYIIPPFTLHSYECDNYYSLFYIHMYENQSLAHRILEDYIFPREIAATAFDRALVERLLEINPERELKFYDPKQYDNSSSLISNISKYAKLPLHISIETKGILFQLLSRFLEKAAPKNEISDNRIEYILAYIRKNIHRALKLEDLAQRCNLSKDHFIRLFHKEVNLTPTSYINQKKIEQAQLMLHTTDAMIKDISFELSFNDVSYFNRLFKKISGLSPSEYRATDLPEKNR